MSFQLIGAGSDLTSTQTQINKTILELQNKERTEIFKDDSGTRRVLLGKGDNNFYGLKVSQEGKDVFSAPDEELVFNSNNNVFKVVQTGQVSITSKVVNGTAVGFYFDNTSVTIDHNLGFIPACMAFRTYDSTRYIPVPGYGLTQKDSSCKSWDWIYTDITDTQLTIYALTEMMIFVAGAEQQGGSTYQIKYYLLQETAN